MQAKECICNTKICLVLVLLTTVLSWAAPTAAQQLEPRRWTHLPSDIQYISFSYAHTNGDIFFDPVLRIEDAESQLDALAMRYAKSFELAGLSVRIDADALYVKGHWEGLLDGAFAQTDRSGLGDPRLRMSVLLHGAPALTGKAFLEYQAAHPVNTIVGAAVALTLPLGQYHSNRFINLGENRYIVRPEIGVLHTRHNWSYELTTSVRVFGDNDEFFPGNSRREQDPLLLVQGHIVYNVKASLWTSIGAGYGFGGESTIDGDRKDDRNDNYFWAFSVGVPLDRLQTLKFTYAGLRKNNLVGTDSNGVMVSWSFVF